MTPHEAFVDWIFPYLLVAIGLVGVAVGAIATIAITTVRTRRRTGKIS